VSPGVNAAGDRVARAPDMPVAKTCFISIRSEPACAAGQAPCPPAPRERRPAAAGTRGVVPIARAQRTRSRSKGPGTMTADQGPRSSAQTFDRPGSHQAAGMTSRVGICNPATPGLFPFGARVVGARQPRGAAGLGLVRAEALDAPGAPIFRHGCRGYRARPQNSPVLDLCLWRPMIGASMGDIR